MEKEFVPFDLAVKLKELGFDAECLGVWDNQEKTLFLNDTRDLSIKEIPTIFTLAPLWQQAFDWFREKYNIHSFCYQPNETGYWATSIDNKAIHNDYPESRLELLKKLIEIVSQC